MFCSERCRSRWRRYTARVARRQARREERTDALAEPRHELRRAAYQAAAAARALAALADAEEERGEGEMEDRDWRPQQAAARYARTALPLFEAAGAALAAAVEADRTAGDSWPVLGRALGVSADTAARRYRRAPAAGEGLGR